jgi:hypothetical protein
MVHVNTMDTAQLCVHVPVTGPVVDVKVSFFLRVLYDVITMSNICLFYTLWKHTPHRQSGS